MGSCSIDGKLSDGGSVVSSFPENDETNGCSFDASELKDGWGNDSTDVTGICRGVTLYCSDDGHGGHQQ